MNDAYISLGSNIGPREKHLNRAIQLLSEEPSLKIVKTSAIYETSPVGFIEQNDFLNMVIQIRTTFSPDELLKYCLDIEQQLGRKRILKNGPRTIDLDILVFNQVHMITETLILPHPRMHERAFVLVPLNEIAPHLKVPQHNQTVQELLAYLLPETLKEVKKWLPS